MSYCDFAVNMEDAIDLGLSYDYTEEESQIPLPTLQWLSDIPLFQSTRTHRVHTRSYLTESDTDSQLRCRFEVPTSSSSSSSSSIGANGANDYSQDDGEYSYASERDDYFERDENPSLSIDEGAEQLSDSARAYAVPVEEDVYERYRFMGEDKVWAETRDWDTIPPVTIPGGQVRVLENTPDWYSKYTSFLSRKTPGEILNTIRRMLDCDKRIEYEIPDYSYQIRGAIHLDETVTHFHINVFRDIYENEYLVEYQRHYGCMVNFQAFYRQCLAHMQTIHEFLVTPVQSPSSGIFNFTEDRLTCLSTTDSSSSSSSSSSSETSCAFDTEEEAKGMSSSSVSKEPTGSLGWVRYNSSNRIGGEDITVVPLYPVNNLTKEDRIEIVTRASRECVLRNGATLTDIRCNALRELVVATDSLGCVYPNPALIIDVLENAPKNLVYRNGLDHEMARIVAHISNNLCRVEEKDMTDAEKRSITELKAGIHSQVVPYLITFWGKTRSGKCEMMDIEADKQIVSLLVILYKDGVSYGRISNEFHEHVVGHVLKRVTSLSMTSPFYRDLIPVLNKVVDVINNMERNE
jgi:hypothetical protein